MNDKGQVANIYINDKEYAYYILDDEIMIRIEVDSFKVVANAYWELSQLQEDLIEEELQVGDIIYLANEVIEWFYSDDNPEEDRLKNDEVIKYYKEVSSND